MLTTTIEPDIKFAARNLQSVRTRGEALFIPSRHELEQVGDVGERRTAHERGQLVRGPPVSRVHRRPGGQLRGVFAEQQREGGRAATRPGSYLEDHWRLLF